MMHVTLSHTWIYLIFVANHFSFPHCRISWLGCNWGLQQLLFFHTAGPDPTFHQIITFFFVTSTSLHEWKNNAIWANTYRIEEIKKKWATTYYGTAWKQNQKAYGTKSITQPHQVNKKKRAQHKSSGWQPRGLNWHLAQKAIYGFKKQFAANYYTLRHVRKNEGKSLC